MKKNHKSSDCQCYVKPETSFWVYFGPICCNFKQYIKNIWLSILHKTWQTWIWTHSGLFWHKNHRAWCFQKKKQKKNTLYHILSQMTHSFMQKIRNFLYLDEKLQTNGTEQRINHMILNSKVQIVTENVISA